MAPCAQSISTLSYRETSDRGNFSYRWRAIATKLSLVRSPPL
ncbi:hypothetical protein [Roseofilum casamattae]|nr:hypothetical protein [Roseofilum casamattae]